MLRYLCFVVGLVTAVFCYGKQILFVNQEQVPVPDVQCTGYAENGDSVASWVSDTAGKTDIGTAEGVKHIVAAHPQYSDKVLFVSRLKDGVNTVVLLPAVALNEVVVTASDVEEFADHTSYRLSQADMARYPNVLQSLNVIPNATVLMNGSVFFEGDPNVKILIDGVDATIQDVQTLAKEDISRIDVYRTPPLRFLSQGVRAVLDVRLKSRLYGGNGGVDMTQSFYSLKGDNTASMYYNYRRSRFTLQYNNQNRHYRKFRRSETLDYEFDGVRYKKTKEGLDSKTHLDDNDLTLRYQINKPDNFLYNIKAGVGFDRNGENFLQKVKAGDESFLATNRLHTRYTKYIVGNYFEKNLGDNTGTFLANINYQRYNTRYNSEYNELSESDIAVTDSRSNYKTQFDAVFSEIQYQLPYKKWGMLSLSVFEAYKHSRYADAVNPFFQTVNSMGGSALWLGRKKSVSWFVMMGLNWYHTASSDLAKAHNLCLPSPLANISWRPSRSTSFSFRYSYSGNVPSIAQLSETNQWIDTKLVYHGNSTLRPYKTHTASLRFNWNTRYLNLSWYNYFNSSPDRICDMYTLSDGYMLQTLVNLSTYRSLGTQLDLSLMPLGNDKLVFWNRVILENLKGSNKEYSWDGYRIQWITSLSLNLEHWTAELFYQYPGKVVDGQLERPRAQCWSVTAMYRPNTNLSFGLEWFMPFGNGFKESERTVNSAPVHADTEYNVMDRNNMVSVKLSYNFSFGRNRNSARPQYDNGDDDSGILRK